MANRKDVSTLSAAQRAQLRTLLDQFISKPTNNPVAEHLAAVMDMSLMIHDKGFLVWRQHFVAEIETWLVNNGRAKIRARSILEAAETHAGSTRPEEYECEHGSAKLRNGASAAKGAS